VPVIGTDDSPMPSRELELAIELCRFQRRTRRPAIVELGRLAELRAEYNAIAEPHRLPNDVINEPLLAGGVRAEWIIPPKAANNRVIIYLHGGCYVMGSVETHRDLITRIALETSIRILGLNYRLAPAHPFPAAVEDAVSAYRWLLETGADPRRIALAGDSAGAGLAIAAALNLRDAGLPLPGAIACISPWVDLAVTGESVESHSRVDPIVNRAMLTGWGKMYLGDHDPRTPLASLLYADLSGLPSLLIQAGSAEALLDDARRLAERASAAGVEITLEVWPEMIHVWHLFAAILPEARQAIATIARFITSRLGPLI
jgi:epsilon-lactone hydrolase